eukprot:gene600-747_t
MNTEKTLEEQYTELLGIVKKRCKTLIPNISPKGYCINDLSILAKSEKERLSLPTLVQNKCTSSSKNKGSSNSCSYCISSKNDILITSLSNEPIIRTSVVTTFNVDEKSLNIDSIQSVCQKCYKLLDFKYIFDHIMINQSGDDVDNNDDNEEIITLLRHFALLNKIDIMQSDWKDRVQESYSILFSLHVIANNFSNINITVGKNQKDISDLNLEQIIDTLVK